MTAQRLTLLTALMFAASVSFSQDPSRPGFVPSWVKDAVFYQIFPERFANGDTANDPPETEPWGGVPRGNNYFGGDLQGIIDHLDYLKELGINAIYLNPIFESATNHKYQTTDYFTIDDNFGTEATFVKLLDECHARGMKVVIDGVFNHTGVDFFAFRDVKEKGADSKYVKWFNIYGFPISSPDNPNYEGWWGLGALPKLMVNNPEVKQYIFDATAYWTKKGIDGWRLDVAGEMPHDFWIEWRKLVKGINPEIYIVGEIWDDATPWLQGDQFDAVMNYRFRGGCVGFIALRNQNAAQFDSVLHAQREQYPDEVNYALQNLIGSHDTERFLTLAEGHVERVKLALLMQMTYPGAPMLYYGDEIGMTGGRDPDCRKTMDWDTTRWNRELLDWNRSLIAIRNANPVLRHGVFSTLVADSASGVFAFMMSDRQDTAIVVMNNGTYEIPVGINVGRPAGEWRDAITSATYEVADGVVQRLRLAPCSGVILTRVR